MKTNLEQIFASKTLTYFLQLTETMNYTQAAQLLGITQPAMTQQIKKLERAVGAPLFYSVGKKLQMTDAGRTMLKTTRAIFAELHQATDEIQQSTDATTGKIQIALLASVEDSAFNAFIAEYYQEYPQIEVSLRMMTRHEIWERLENNQVDLAVMYLPDDTIKNWQPYESKQIIAEELLFLHHDEALAKRERVAFKDTLAKPWVTYPEDYFLSHLLKEAFKNQLVDYPKTAAQFTTPFQLMQFLNTTGVNTALPNTFVQAHQQDLKAYAVPFAPAVNFELAFVYRKGKDLIPRVAKFFAAFDEYVAKRDYMSRLSHKRVTLNE